MWINGCYFPYEDFKKSHETFYQGWRLTPEKSCKAERVFRREKSELFPMEIMTEEEFSAYYRANETAGHHIIVIETDEYF